LSSNTGDEARARLRRRRRARERPPQTEKLNLRSLALKHTHQHSASSASTEKAAHPDWDTLGFGLRDVGPVSPVSWCLFGGAQKTPTRKETKNDAEKNDARV
jgi:hypothetical protein